MKTKTMLTLLLLVALTVGCGGGSSGSSTLAGLPGAPIDGGGLEPPDGEPIDVDPPEKPSVPGAYPIVDTGQDACYDDETEMATPAAGSAFFGQDAQHAGHQPSYTDHGDGTVTDHVTGLMWQQGYAEDRTYSEAMAYPDELNVRQFAGYGDWRLPTIKELYSLIDFRGTDPAIDASDESGLTPFIDVSVFDFEYGDTGAGERIIDSQWATTTRYVANSSMLFGVNFADGRIKGYGLSGPGPGEKTFNVRLCRGNPDYGLNDFNDNGDGTVTDQATNLMWTKADSGERMNWEDALAFAAQKNAENHLGHDDWRLPNAKELHSIVDYTRSPDTSNSPAIDAFFDTSTITNLNGNTDYPFFWSSTTHLSAMGMQGRAVYVAFGRGTGTYDGVNITDVHGAGCQRSDPKDGDPNDFPNAGNGPQGDVSRVFNYVRLVRDAD